jgi:4,5-DOPA dioxygenase extradiol
VYDFRGFPDPLYRLRYDAPGAPDLAPRVSTLLEAAGIAVQTLDHGGLDHGLWIPLRFMWPDASVPVLPLSFSPQDSPAQLLALGRALAPLADEGVLIIGSGSLTHNLSTLFGPGGRPPVDAPETPETAAFRTWVQQRSVARDWAALTDYRRQAPFAADMHPTDEHWLPFYVAAGAGGADDTPQRIHTSLTYGTLAMDAYAFGPGATALLQALPSLTA